MEEIAALFDVHRNTVRAWLKQGLPVIDDKRPMLILGRDLRAFLQTSRMKKKRPCNTGEIYCLRCRVPRTPAGNMAECQVLTLTAGNLIGICPRCESLMYRRVSLAKLEQIRAPLDITMVQAPLHIGRAKTLWGGVCNALRTLKEVHKHSSGKSRLNTLIDTKSQIVKAYGLVFWERAVDIEKKKQNIRPV